MEKKGAGARGGRGTTAGNAVNKGLTKEPGYQVWRQMAHPVIPGTLLLASPWPGPRSEGEVWSILDDGPSGPSERSSPEASENTVSEWVNGR